MTDHDAFLEAICERPDDDTPRLMYADWLMERGDPRGEFIQAQMELAKLAPEKSGGLTKWSSVDAAADAVRSDDPRVEKLLRRHGELLREHGHDWATPVARALQCGAWDGGGNPDYSVPRWQFRRGFVSHVALPHNRFLEHAAALFLAAPIEAVTLSDKNPRLSNDPEIGWYCRELRHTQDRDDLWPDLWGYLDAPESPGRWKWYTTVEAANADLSNACVKLGRQRAAKAREEMAKR